MKTISVHSPPVAGIESWAYVSFPRSLECQTRVVGHDQQSCGMCVPDGGGAEGRPQNLPLISQVVGGKITCMQDNLGGTTQTCGAMRHDACAVQNMHGSMHDHQIVHACMAGPERTHGRRGNGLRTHGAARNIQHNTHHTHTFGCVCAALLSRDCACQGSYSRHTRSKLSSWRQAPRGPHQLAREEGHAHTLGGRGGSRFVDNFCKFQNVIEKSFKKNVQ
jgi:hypothetical protein